VGKLAALIVASSFGYILATNDVRMDAILTSAIIFATLHLIKFIQQKQQWVSIVLGSLGLALGFSTKGHIGVLLPVIAVLAYIIYLRQYELFYSWKWLIVIVLFFLFISPVLFAFYYQFNLHPEKEIRGENNINGIKFILWNQNTERFKGEKFGDAGSKDYSFFFHSFLWTFFPWAILAYYSVVKRVKHFFSRKQEWLTTIVFLITFLIISFAGYKLPHYLNIVFPFCAIMVAQLLTTTIIEKRIKQFTIFQNILLLFSSCLLVILNSYFFPLKYPILLIPVILLLIIIYFFITTGSSIIHKLITRSVLFMIGTFFILNISFYPSLLKYQGGNEMAFKTAQKIDPKRVYLWKGLYSPSWNFYTSTKRNIFTDTAYQPGKELWILCAKEEFKTIKQKGYTTGKIISTPDYPVGRLKLSFLNPTTREDVCSAFYLVQINGRL
jgi:hypothetical protein